VAAVTKWIKAPTKPLPPPAKK